MSVSGPHAIDIAFTKTGRSLGQQAALLQKELRTNGVTIDQRAAIKWMMEYATRYTSLRNAAYSDEQAHSSASKEITADAIRSHKTTGTEKPGVNVMQQTNNSGSDYRAGYTAGISAERDRITRIMATTPAGFEKEATAAINAGTKPDDFAAEVLKTQKDRGVTLDDLRGGGQGVPHGGSPEPNKNKSKKLLTREQIYANRQTAAKISRAGNQ